MFIENCFLQLPLDPHDMTAVRKGALVQVEGKLIDFEAALYLACTDVFVSELLDLHLTPDLTGELDQGVSKGKLASSWIEVCSKIVKCRTNQSLAQEEGPLQCLVHFLNLFQPSCEPGRLESYHTSQDGKGSQSSRKGATSYRSGGEQERERETRSRESKTCRRAERKQVFSRSWGIWGQLH